MFSVWSVPRVYKGIKKGSFDLVVAQNFSRVGDGSLK
jgi:hypothetical protein